MYILILTYGRDDIMIDENETRFDVMTQEIKTNRR